jgi:hypothetical protein
MKWLSQFFYMEAKFGPLEKRIKNSDIGMRFFPKNSQAHIFFPKNSQAHIFDHRRNEERLEELQVEPVDEKLRKYKSYWLRYVTRMDTNKMPELMLNYITNGGRPLGRPLKGLSDEADSGLSRPNSCRMMVVVVVVMMMMMMTFLTRSLILA